MYSLQLVHLITTLSINKWRQSFFTRALLDDSAITNYIHPNHFRHQNTWNYLVGVSCQIFEKLKASYLSKKFLNEI